MKLFEKVEHCYGQDGKPFKCPHCGGTNFQSEITEIVAGNVAEEYTRCTDCNNIISFWAYGSYQPQPRLVFHPVKTVKNIANWFIVKGFTQ